MYMYLLTLPLLTPVMVIKASGLTVLVTQRLSEDWVPSYIPIPNPIPSKHNADTQENDELIKGTLSFKENLPL